MVAKCTKLFDPGGFGPGNGGFTIKKTIFTCVYMGEIGQFDSGE
jgi:hypothetical protein